MLFFLSKGRSDEGGHFLYSPQCSKDQGPELIGASNCRLADMVMLDVVPHGFIRIEFRRKRSIQHSLAGRRLNWFGALSHYPEIFYEHQETH